jgi:aryl-alcohol dehydrogenase-like predicted oxidoreductase
VLSWPITGAIVGARSAQQVDGWIEAATVDLTNSDLDEIADAIHHSAAGIGPARPSLQRAFAH